MSLNNIIITPLDKLSFSCNLSINNFVSGKVKIDTGCTLTSIPLMSLGYSKEQCKSLKKEDLKKYRDGTVQAVRSLGVETDKDIVLSPLSKMSDLDLLNDRSVCFVHASSFRLNDYEIGITRYKVNYDRFNHGLIGMSTLSNFEFYCGLSRQNNEYLFIGVLKDQEDKSDYYRALEYHFGVVTNCKDLLYYQFKDSEITKDEASGFFNWLKTYEGGK